jgi:hypothetical protein
VEFPGPFGTEQGASQFKKPSCLDEMTLSDLPDEIDSNSIPLDLFPASPDNRLWNQNSIIVACDLL